jgi:hypothetical protein
MGAKADAFCGAPYGARSPARVNIRNGYPLPAQPCALTLTQSHALHE